MLHCPVVPTHAMCEIAEGLFQCPDCGAGPGMYWALSEVEVIDDSADAQCIVYRPDLLSYVVSYLHWRLQDGKRVADSLSSELLGHVIELHEMQAAPLPHISTAPRKLSLRPGMFPSPLGAKAYGQKAAPRGTSAAAPSPGGSRGHSRPRRKKVGT